VKKVKGPFKDTAEKGAYRQVVGKERNRVGETDNYDIQERGRRNGEKNKRVHGPLPHVSRGPVHRREKKLKSETTETGTNNEFRKGMRCCEGEVRGKKKTAVINLLAGGNTRLRHHGKSTSGKPPT